MRPQFARAISFFPTEPQGRFYVALVALHASGAFAAFLMSLICDGAYHATQRAMLPVAIPTSGLQNVSAIQAYRAAFPWSEDRVFTTHLWNPYLLIVVFEWLTAAFALCNLWDWLSKPLEYIMGWIALGLGATTVWFVVGQYAEAKKTDFCFAMFLLVYLSFAVAALAVMRLAEMIKQRKDAEAKSGNPENPDEPQADGDSTPLLVQGRVWQVPRKVATLKQRRLGTETVATSDDSLVAKEDVPAFVSAMDAAGFRYVEYCITAPLLFLALMMLLVADAPAW
jgi:hypothetical protein